MTGSTSSAVAVALNKFAEREKMLYLVAISGSNDTTGKDCARYSFRQCFYGETAANAIGPVLVKNFGKNKKAAYHDAGLHLRPHRDQVDERLSEQERRLDHGDQPGLAARHARTSASICTNIANSGAEFIINVNWGRDAVLSIQQAKQFGLTPKMKMVIPYQIPFLAKEVGPELTEGVYAATDFWWTLEDKYPLAKMFVDGVRQEIRLQARMGRQQRLHAIRHLGAHGLRGRHASIPPDVIKTYEKGETFDSTVGEVHFRAADHQLVRPVIIVRGKAPKDDEEQGGLLGGARGRAGRAADAEARRVRLQSRRLHLSAASANLFRAAAEKDHVSP